MEKLYTVREVAKLLGTAEVTIRQWILYKKINSIKINGMRRITESELTRLMKGE